MRKMRLDLHSLQVETFATRMDGGPTPGTVLAHGSAGVCDLPPDPDTHFDQHTCDVLSCGGTCILTFIPCGTCGNGSRFDPCT